jgi:Regulator of chromosome condensation (RCC1) repeat
MNRVASKAKTRNEIVTPLLRGETHDATGNCVLDSMFRDKIHGACSAVTPLDWRQALGRDPAWREGSREQRGLQAEKDDMSSRRCSGVIALAVMAVVSGCSSGGSNPATTGSAGSTGAGTAGTGGAAGGGAAGTGGQKKYLTGVTALSSGESHSCAIVAAGEVACWGVATNGALGNIMITNATGAEEAQIIPGISGAVSISVGTEFACAVLQDGTVKCWGNNADGNLGGGDGVMSTSGFPVTVQGLTGASSVSAGDSFACAVAGGEVWCWGSNVWDELGTAGVPASSDKPVKIAGLSDVTAVSANSQHACALSGGSAWCWGGNADAESGVISPDRIAAPVQVTGVSGIIALTTAAEASYAILANGSAWCWGYDGCEQNGARSFTMKSPVPLAIPTFTNLTALTATVGSFCGLQKGGTVQCPSSPAAVAGLTGVKAISSGRNFTCLQVGDGVQCWGDTTTPSPVAGPCCGEDNPSFSSGLPSATTVADLTADQFQTLCQKARGDTDGLQESCKVYAVEVAASAPKTTSDADLKTLCQTTFDSCWPVPTTGPFSPTTCPAVAASPKCTPAVAEVEACVNEQSWFAKLNAPLVPACGALSRAALDAILFDQVQSAPACSYVYQTCGQLFQSP